MDIQGLLFHWNEWCFPPSLSQVINNWIEPGFENAQCSIFCLMNSIIFNLFRRSSETVVILIYLCCSNMKNYKSKYYVKNDKTVSMFAYACILIFSDGWRYQNGWIFGKVSAFDPLPPHFRKIKLQFFRITSEKKLRLRSKICNIIF